MADEDGPQMVHDAWHFVDMIFFQTSPNNAHGSWQKQWFLEGRAEDRDYGPQHFRVMDTFITFDSWRLSSYGQHKEEQDKAKKVEAKRKEGFDFGFAKNPERMYMIGQSQHGLKQPTPQAESQANAGQQPDTPPAPEVVVQQIADGTLPVHPPRPPSLPVGFRCKSATSSEAFNSSVVHHLLQLALPWCTTARSSWLWKTRRLCVKRLQCRRMVNLQISNVLPKNVSVGHPLLGTTPAAVDSLSSSSASFSSTSSAAQKLRASRANVHRAQAVLKDVVPIVSEACQDRAASLKYVEHLLDKAM